MRTWLIAVGLLSVCAVTAAFTDPAQAAGAAVILALLLTACVVAATNYAAITAAVAEHRPSLRSASRCVADDARGARLVVDRR